MSNYQEALQEVHEIEQDVLAQIEAALEIQEQCYHLNVEETEGDSSVGAGTTGWIYGTCLDCGEEWSRCLATPYYDFI